MNTLRHTKSHTLVAVASMVLVAATAISATFAATPATASPGGVIASGETLSAGQSVTSGNGAFVLVMQSDGNLVAYLDMAVYGAGEPVWNSGTGGNPGARAVMQTAGNLVVYSRNGTALWWTDFGGHPGAYAVMQNDGNIVVYAGAPVAANAKWVSRTNGAMTSATSCTTWSNVFGSITTCIDTSVWHNGAHAGVLSSSAVRGRCWVDGPATLVGRSCGNAGRKGSYTMSGGVNEDWLNQSITSNPPLASFPVCYCDYVRVDVAPNGNPRVKQQSAGPFLSPVC